MSLFVIFDSIVMARSDSKYQTILYFAFDKIMLNKKLYQRSKLTMIAKWNVLTEVSGQGRNKWKFIFPRAGMYSSQFHQPEMPSLIQIYHQPDDSRMVSDVRWKAESWFIICDIFALSIAYHREREYFAGIIIACRLQSLYSLSLIAIFACQPSHTPSAV